MKTNREQNADKELPNPDILCMLSPNLGILEQWLPVLYELKLRQNDLRIFAFFPNPRVVSQIKSDDMLSKLGEQVFNGAIFKTWFGAWMISNSLLDAKRIQDNLYEPKYINYGLKKLSSYSISKSFASLLEKKMKKIAYIRSKKDHTIDLNQLKESVRVVCFDVYEETKEYARVPMHIFQNASWFSLMHGISLENIVMKQPKDAYEKKRARKTNVIAYVYSPKEIPSYIENYNLRPSDIKTVGVPRHQEFWLNEVITQSESDAIPEGPYIFVVSRPASANYFQGDPKQSKKAILEEIKKISEEFNYKVVVRLHPKETTEGLFEEVFKSEEYDKKWCYSLSHPYYLGKNSVFCITFYSGVAIDMVALGVPIIERLNYTEMSSSSAFIQDDSGKTTSIFKQLGLVLGAGNYNELREHAFTIINDREHVLNQQKNLYNEIFKAIDSPIDYIADDIEEKLIIK